MGAIIAALCASGMNVAATDAPIYEYFVRNNPLGDYTLPRAGLIRGQRTMAVLRRAYGETLVEELPKQFRCVSVDLLARRTIVHRRGLLADVVGCSLRLPGVYAPKVYDGTLHVDGGVLNNLPVDTSADQEGPEIAVSVISRAEPDPGSTTRGVRAPRGPGIVDTLMRTMTIGSGMASAAAMAQADVVIQPDTSSVGFLEFHQIDRAREAGRAAAREALPHVMKLRTLAARRGS